MVHFWCWLFWSCAAPTPAPPQPPGPPAEPPPAAAATTPPAAGDSGAIEREDGADLAKTAPAEPGAMPPPPEPQDTARLTPLPPAIEPGRQQDIGETVKPAPMPDTGPPAWRRYAVAAPPADGKPTLSIVIDDMGVNQAQSARALALPGPLTLSWLPYAPKLAEQVAAGAAHGDETMLHMPMEALGRADPGPGTLRTWLPPAANLASLRAALDLVPTAVALNQHEGSVASLSAPLMDLVMGELRARRMAFLDSLTIPHSVALARAEAAGVPAVARDTFIDNDAAPAAIRARLADAEAIARRAGHAVLIGHPRPATMDVLAQYLPGVASRGFVLWPLSAAIAAEPHALASADLPPAGSAARPAFRTTASAGEPAVAPTQNSGAE
jgi:uncharacterized protein